MTKLDNGLQSVAMSSKIIQFGSHKVSVSTDVKAQIRTLLREIFDTNHQNQLTDAEICEAVRKKTGARWFEREQVRVYRYRDNNGGLGNPPPEVKSVAYRG